MRKYKAAPEEQTKSIRPYRRGGDTCSRQSFGAGGDEEPSCGRMKEGLSVKYLNSPGPTRIHKDKLNSLGDGPEIILRFGNSP